jgi:2-polyprenyl-6-methoxyphenol hydroxylase-like FAD-dependent oxidoreductase
VDPKVALKYVEGWVPWVTELIKATPEMGAVDYKLLWRDPYETWASPHGRVVQIGDAAHAFLPTSASGATMAMEDAFSLAACLHLGGKDNLPLAVKVHNKLRYVEISVIINDADTNLITQIQEGYLCTENWFQEPSTVSRDHLEASAGGNASYLSHGQLVEF